MIQAIGRTKGTANFQSRPSIPCSRGARGKTPWIAGPGAILGSTRSDMPEVFQLQPSCRTAGPSAGAKRRATSDVSICSEREGDPRPPSRSEQS